MTGAAWKGDERASASLGVSGVEERGVVGMQQGTEAAAATATWESGKGSGQRATDRDDCYLLTSPLSLPVAY